MPFELTMSRPGRWGAMWREKKIRVAVAGTERAPHPELLTTLREVVARWPRVEGAITDYLRALEPDHHVPLDSPGRGGFAARSCGFDEDLSFESVAVMDREAPRRVTITFYTGHPDGYATFEIVLDDFEPRGISAFAS